MRRYELTLDAKNDLIEIWNYTENTWGEEQADRYLRLVDRCFADIGTEKFAKKSILRRYPTLRAVHCEHHYVFCLLEKKPMIVAILHEKMDCIKRLKKRLAD